MKTINRNQLDSVCGGVSSAEDTQLQVSAKAKELAGADGVLQLGEARQLISSVESNGFNAGERAGMRDVLDDQAMTKPAMQKITSFLNALHA
jgi:hypothetical protein